jgi:hypothetical protein
LRQELLPRHAVGRIVRLGGLPIRAALLHDALRFSGSGRRQSHGAGKEKGRKRDPDRGCDHC